MLTKCWIVTIIVTMHHETQTTLFCIWHNRDVMAKYNFSSKKSLPTGLRQIERYVAILSGKYNLLGLANIQWIWQRGKLSIMLRHRRGQWKWRLSLFHFLIGGAISLCVWQKKEIMRWMKLSGWINGRDRDVCLILF